MVAIPTTRATLFVDGKPVSFGEIRFAVSPLRRSEDRPQPFAVEASGSFTVELSESFDALLQQFLELFHEVTPSDLRSALTTALERYRRPDIGPRRRARYRRRVRRIARLLAKAQAHHRPEAPDDKDFPQPGAVTPGSLQP
jgi:hypothetical protein